MKINDNGIVKTDYDFNKLVCVNTTASNLLIPSRIHLDCEEIQLNTNNVKIVLNSDKLTRELETCDYIELNGFVFRKEEK